MHFYTFKVHCTMQKQPVLTIAIPTYNRGKVLERTINCVFSEIGENDNVEVLVCDNASTDDTEARMEKYKYDPRFSYYRAKENMGADKNFHECVLQAKSYFVWRLGSDDAIVENSLKAVLNRLENSKGRLSGICVNYGIVKDNLGVYEKKKFTPELSQDLDVKRIDDISPSDFASLFLGYFPFISSTIINRQLYIEEYKNYKVLDSGGYDFIGMYLLLIMKYGNWGYISNYTVICHRSSQELIGEDFKGGGFFYTFDLNYALVRIYKEYIGDEYFLFYQKVLKEYHSRYFMGDVIKFRLSGVSSLSMSAFILKNVSKYDLDILALLKFLFVALSPLNTIKRTLGIIRK